MHAETLCVSLGTADRLWADVLILTQIDVSLFQMELISYQVIFYFEGLWLTILIH